MLPGSSWMLNPGRTQSNKLTDALSVILAVFMYTNKSMIMSKQTAVRLPDPVYDRLKVLAERTGRSATYYIREAIEAHLDDLEDIYLAEALILRVRDGQEPTYSLAEVESELGLAD
jgi:RHH-type rel operon transcriptional repressor/antitoxin RelB